MSKVSKVDDGKKSVDDTHKISYDNWVYNGDGKYCGNGIFYNEEKRYLRYKDTIIPFKLSKISLFIEYLFKNYGQDCTTFEIMQYISAGLGKGKHVSLSIVNSQIYKSVYSKITPESKFSFLLKHIKKGKTGRLKTYSIGR